MTYPLLVALLLLIGMSGGKIASKLKLPSVTGYILFGLALGPSLLNIITQEIYYNLSFVNNLALGMLAISIGAELHYRIFKQFGKNLVIMSIGNSLFTATLVTLATWLLGMQLSYAVILGTLSMSVSPSGVVAMIKETKAKGDYTQNLLGLVAFDNLFTIILFGVVVSLVQTTGAADASGIMLVLLAILDIIIAIVLGAVSGVVLSYFIRRELTNDKLLTLLLAFILLNTGLSTYYNLSPILTNMMTGVAITNLTSRKLLLTSLMDRIELPIFVLFLTLAGAKLDVAIFGTVGLIGIGYITARMIGKYFGAYIFSQFTNYSTKIKRNIGFGLIPQAGVAIGLATIAEKNIPGSTGLITGVILTGVIFFEIVGPLLLGKALHNVGEASE